MEKNKIVFVANLSHNYSSLKVLAAQSEKNITELFGSSNLPLGILSIDSYVRKIEPNTETRIIDLNAEFLKKISKGEINSQLNSIVENFDSFLFDNLRYEIEEFQPDIVGISTLFDKSLSTLLTLSQKIKEVFPKVLVVAGGHPVNNLYSKIFEHELSGVDAICLGEGEIPFAELIVSTDKWKYLQDSPYFITKENYYNGEFQTLNDTFLDDLDEIPLYDFDGFFNKYGDEILYMHNNILDVEHSFNKQAVIMTSRGCPYNCIFCASKSVHGQKMRKHSVERIKSEIDYWVDCHKVNTIGFIDDHFLFDINRVIEICDYAGSKNVDIRFPNGLAIAPITGELIECLVRNNVREVQLALESGSERVLREIIRKPLSIKLAENVFNMFLDTNIFVKVFLVMGFPDETREDIHSSLEFLRKANFHWASISSPTPISGSRLLEESLINDYADANYYEKISFFSNCFENKDLSAEMNNDIRYTINLDVNFVHNPYMRMKKYDLAIERFESIIRNYPKHAFAHYYLAQCLEKIDSSNSLIANAKKTYNEIIASDSKWQKYANYFNLELKI